MQHAAGPCLGGRRIQMRRHSTNQKRWNFNLLMLCLTLEINTTFPLAAGNRSERGYDNLFTYLRKDSIWRKDLRRIIIAKLVTVITAAYCHIPVLHFGIMYQHFSTMFFLDKRHTVNIQQLKIMFECVCMCLN